LGARAGAHAAADAWPSREEADRTLWWLLDVARLAARERQWSVLDTAVQGRCDWKDWMRGLTGHAASVVASALPAQPNGARLLYELADDRQVDPATRSRVCRP